jgi:hypothetical protein
MLSSLSFDEEIMVVKGYDVNTLLIFLSIGFDFFTDRASRDLKS